MTDHTKSPPLISIVVPVYNEAETIPLLQQRLNQLAIDGRYTFEFVYIDDGSHDETAQLLISMERRDPRIRTVTFSRNFGKEAAITAGLKVSRGAAVVLIDADLQDPPECILDMLQAWRGGFDIVNMRRRRRYGEPWHRRLAAWLFYRGLNALADESIPEDIGDFRLLSRAAVDALNNVPERNRYMKGLFAWIGFNTTTLTYDRAPRSAGQSKWSYGQLFGLAIDAITSFSVAPLRIVTLSGALTALASIAVGAVIILKTLLLGEVVRGYTSLVTLITFTGGIQLFAIGIIGEYIGKVYLETKKRPLYILHHASDKTEQYNQKTTWSSLAANDRQL